MYDVSRAVTEGRRPAKKNLEAMKVYFVGGDDGKPEEFLANVREYKGLAGGNGAVSKNGE